jgi:predicted ATPase/class 3 adenylate cyclase
LNNVSISTDIRSLPSGSLTFLMTDVAGSTRLWEARADTMRAAILRHDHIVRIAVEANGGQLIKERGEGDSHFCVFPTPEGAVRAATAIQERMPKEEWETGAPLVVRMSIHSAQAEPHGGDYYGRDVNRCARIRGAAHAGQILVSDITRDQVQEFDFLDLGLHRLNDLSEQQRIYQVLAPELQREFPPIKSLNAVKHNLPVQLTSFIGREKELEELRKLAWGPRLITILGPGGAGKTRTALQLAAESIEQVKGGVWFVDLSPIQDPSTLGQKVIEDLHVRVGADDPDDAIAAHFQGEKTLLVLDNCEHVAREAAVFADKLLKKCPDLFIISTSREPLGVSGERAYRLPPMNISADKAQTLDDISHLDSVQLLLDRARAKGHEEVLQQSKPQVVLELCKKLDGIPLALEQAAANLGVLSPEAMLSRLDERLNVLRIDDEGVEARHRTLSAAIDWSYETLTEPERELFLDLAVFVGGWTLEAAESICTKPKVLDLMQRLVSKSLVWPEATERGDRRFRLLETMREYALEKRSTMPHGLEERHLAYFSHLAKVGDQAGLDAEDGKWARALDADYTNVTTALNRAIISKESAFEGLDLAVSLFSYWTRRGYLREGGNWLQRAIDAAPGAPTELRGDALNMLGIFAWYQGNLVSADFALRSSLELWKDLGNDAKSGATLNNMAILALERDNEPEAMQLMREAAVTFERLSDDSRLSQVLGNIGMLEGSRGRYEEAIALQEKSVKICRRLQNRESLGIQITNLLGLYAETGGLDRYLNLMEESLAIARVVGSPTVTSITLDLMGFLARSKGESVIAAYFLGAAKVAAASMGAEISLNSEPFRRRLHENLQTDLGRETCRQEVAKGMATTTIQALDAAEEFLRSI